MATDKYDLHTIDYSIQGWDAIMTTDMEKLDDVINSRIEATLGETVALQDALYLNTDGKYYKALADGTKQPSLGLAIETGVLDDTIRIQRTGPVTNTGWAWSVIGATVYLSTAISGDLTESEPSENIQIVGTVLSPTSIFVNIELTTTSSGSVGGTSNHSTLSNLAYADSGHTGFSPDTHLHDDRYYMESEVDTISGSLRTDITSITNITNYADSPMIVTGGEITTGTNAGTFKVAALTALIRKTDSTIGELAYVTKTEEDNIAITLSCTQYYVLVNYNGGSPTISITTDLDGFYDKIPIGCVMKDSLNEVHYISGCYRLQDGVAKLHYRAFELYSLYLTSGNTIAYSGTNNFTMTAGVVYEGINRLTQDSYNSVTTSFQYVYSDGGGGWTTVSGNAIDYGHYDDGDGTLGNVGVAKVSCHWVYRHSGDDHVYVLYGTDSYTPAEAEVAEIPNGPDHLSQFGCLIGKIIAPYAGGSFTKIQMVTDVVFTGTSVATHNDLGGLNDGDYKHLTATQYTDLTGSAIPDTLLDLSDTPAVYDSNKYLRSTTSGTVWATVSGGTGIDHSELSNLAYADSGHTGFQPAGDYATDSELTSVSGSLQTNIDGKIANLSEDTTPELGGQLVVGELDIKLDALLSADGKYSGSTRDGVLGSTLAYGDLVYLNTTDQRWELADADAETTSGDVDLAIVLTGGDDGDTRLLLIDGYVREDDWNFTSYGQSLFVSTTSGTMTQTAPTGSGDIVRVVGYASTTADQIHFKPSQTWIELS